MLIALVLAWLPGIIAEVRKHRHVMLVSLLGFASLWIHPLLWLLALLWAWKVRPAIALGERHRKCDGETPHCCSNLPVG